MIDLAVIPAAGLGTRLFTITKETPKEMIPIFYRTQKDEILIKDKIAGRGTVYCHSCQK